MKVAVIGGGPAGLLASWEFGQLGAEVVLFGGATLGGGLRKLGEVVPEFSLKRPLKELLPPSLMERQRGEERWVDAIEPLVEKLQSLIRIKNVRAERVHKSFLGDGEIPEGGSRLVDLFRVVWSQNDLEFYEDFDVVIEAGGFYHRPLPAGPGNSLALNEEKREREGWLSKSWKVFEHIERLSGKERVLLVGSGTTAALFCRYFFTQYPEGKLDLVTTEREPFEKMKTEGLHPELFEWVQSRIESSFQRWKKFRQKDIIPDFCIYNGYNVVSIDKLEDRENLFVTIEAPAFRGGKERIKTLSVEGVLVATGFRRMPAPPEPGHYRLCGDIPQIIQQIQQVRADVLSFFSQD